MRIPFFRGAAAALLLLTGTAAALPVPACAKTDNVEVQVEYGVPRYFENRHIRDVNVSIFQEAAKHAFAVPQTPSWIEISNAVYPELQAAILGDKTSKEALDAAAEKATAILEDAGKL